MGSVAVHEAEGVMRLMKAFDLYPHKCACCGKKFEGGMEWAYKTEVKKRLKWFCSWSCLQRFRRKAG